MMLVILCLWTCAIATDAFAIKEKRPLFKDVPRSHWAYAAYTQLVRAGVACYPTICFPSSRGAHYDAQHRRLTRYESAIATQRALAVLKAKNRQAAGKRTAQQIAFSDATNKLAGEFRLELAQLNK